MLLFECCYEQMCIIIFRVSIFPTKKNKLQTEIDYKVLEWGRNRAYLNINAI